MAQVHRLEAQVRPPERMRSLFRRRQKCSGERASEDPDIVDVSSTAVQNGLVRSRNMAWTELQGVFREFTGRLPRSPGDSVILLSKNDSWKYEFETLPG